MHILRAVPLEQAGQSQFRGRQRTVAEKGQTPVQQGLQNESFDVTLCQHAGDQY